MSKKGAFCFRAANKKEAAKCVSPEHNKREKEYMQKMLDSENPRDKEVVEDIRSDLSENNIYYETCPGKSIDQYKKEAEERYRNNIHQKPQKGTMFIRPCILNVNANVTLEHIKKMSEIIEIETGMTLIGAYYHADEGHWHTSNGKRFWVPNYHIHANFLSQHLKDAIEEYDYIDKYGKQIHFKKVIKTGRTCRNMNYSKLQGLLAHVFGMERGEVINNEKNAFLDSTIKHMRQRSRKAAQLIKAESKIKAFEEKADLLIASKQAELNGFQNSIEQKKKELSEMKDKVASVKNGIPSSLQTLRFIQNLRDKVISDVEVLFSKYCGGEVIGIHRDMNENGNTYEAIELEKSGVKALFHVYEKTGNIYRIYPDGKKQKYKSFPELAEYLRASISPELQEILEEAYPLSPEMRKKKSIKQVTR